MVPRCAAPYILDQLWSAIRLHVCILWQFFCKCAKKINQKNEENEQLFEGSYLRNGWCDLLQIWYAFSPDMLAPAQQIWSFFMQEITELQRCINHFKKIYVDILTLRGVAKIKSLPRQNYELELKYRKHHFTQNHNKVLRLMARYKGHCIIYLFIYSFIY